MSPRLPDAIEHWSIDRLQSYARNPRTHDDAQVAQIAASIVEFGWTNPVLISVDGDVIAGHGRLEAARRLGLDTVPVVILDHLTPAQRRAYVIADNKLALNASWDDALLAGELHALNSEGFDLTLTGFGEDELDDLLAPIDENEADTDAAADDIDETPALPTDPVTLPGDL